MALVYSKRSSVHGVQLEMVNWGWHIHNNCSLYTIFHPRTPSLQCQALSHLVLRCYKWLMLHKREFTQVRLKVILYTASEEGTCIKLVNITSTFRVNERVFIWSGKVKYAIDFGIIAMTIVLCLFTVQVAIIIIFHFIISVVPQELYDVQSAYCIA